MVHEEASSGVLVVDMFLAIGVQQTSLGVAVEMIHFLSREQLVGLQRVLVACIGLLGAPRHGLTALFGILASSAQWTAGEFGGRLVELLCAFRGCEHTLTE